MNLKNEKTDPVVSKSVEELRNQVKKFLENDHDRIVVTVTVSEKGEDENGKS